MEIPSYKNFFTKVTIVIVSNIIWIFCMVYSYVYLDVNLASQNWWTLWLVYCLVIGPAINIGVEVLVYKVRPLQKKDECKTYKWICILSTGFIYLYFVWFFWGWYVLDFLDFLFA